MLFIFLRLCVINLLASSVPVLQWSIEYFPDQLSHFTEVIQASTGDFYISGWTSNQTLFKVDQQGELIWSYGIGGYGNQRAYSLLELTDGAIAVTGYCKTSDYFSLFIAKVQPNGSPVWELVVDPSTEHSECGFGITEFPDGNIMVCGFAKSKSFLYGGEAYIVLITPEGELIWDRYWGSASATNYALQSSCDPDGYNVLAHGTDGGTGAPHVLWYNLNGQYLGRERIQALASYYTGNGYANSDSGFTFTSNAGYAVNSPQYAMLTHLDEKAQMILSIQVEDYMTRGMCVSPTLSGEYLYGGWEIYYIEPGQPWWTGERRGVLYSFNGSGEELWYLHLDPDDCQRIEGVIETSSGDILACGGSDESSNLFLFSDNTGIVTHPEHAQMIDISLRPNPFSESLSVTIEFQEFPGEIHVTIRDLSGRVIHETENLELYSGGGVMSWTPEPEIADGCYIITATTACSSVSRTCLKL